MDNYRYVDLGSSLNLVNVSGGLVNKGAYNAATDYQVGDAVSYNGSSYVMYADAAAGTVPTNTTYWQVLASKGDAGATGATGPQGPTGPGVAAGGTAGQILAKIDLVDYNTEWIDNYTTDIRQYVKNDSGTTINKGEAVYVSGANGTNILVKKAKADSDATSSNTLGLALTTMAANDMGYIISEGTISGINTSAAGAAGDPVYLSGATAGALIYGFANKPKAPVHLVYLGVVTKKNASTGEIFVKVQNGYELDEIHDVQITSVANGQTITWDSTSSLWKNHTLVKGDVGLGNVDNTSDVNKPISSATQTALDAKLDDSQLDTDGTLAANSDSKIASQKATKTYTDTGLATKEPTITAGTTSQYWRGDKSWQTLNKSAVGLGNVDNTSDANKPVSTATQTALDGKVDKNSTITGATKTKITYDSKGLVTAGADATTADIADSTNKRYVTDTNLTVLSNTSGTNTGDETQSTIKTKLGAATTSVDGYLTSTDWNTFNSKQAALGFTPENVANKSTNTSLGSSDTLYPSQNAVKSYVDTGLSGKENTISSGTTSQYWRGDKSWQTLDKTAVGLGNVTNDAQVKYSAPTIGGNLNLNGNAVVITGTAGENLVAGNLVYLKSDGKYWKASNTAVGTASTKLAMCNATINANATGELIVYGSFTTTGLTAGSNYFVGASGAITTTSPTTEDYVVRLVGTALSTTVLEFNPDSTWLTYKV